MVKVEKTYLFDEFGSTQDELIIKCDRCNEEVDKLYTTSFNDYPDEYCSRCIDKLLGIEEVEILL